MMETSQNICFLRCYAVASRGKVQRSFVMCQDLPSTLKWGHMARKNGYMGLT